MTSSSRRELLAAWRGTLQHKIMMDHIQIAIQCFYTNLFIKVFPHHSEKIFTDILYCLIMRRLQTESERERQESYFSCVLRSLINCSKPSVYSTEQLRGQAPAYTDVITLQRVAGSSDTWHMESVTDCLSKLRPGLHGSWCDPLQRAR